MDMENRVGIDCGSGDGEGRQGRGEQWGKIGTTVTEQQNSLKMDQRHTKG